MLYLDKDYKIQLRAIFSWLSEIIKKDEFILLDTPRGNNIFYFKFPLKYGDKPKKLLWGKSKIKTFSFIIKIGGSEKKVTEEGDWYCIFRSPDINIFENRERKLDILPLRFGLSDEEQKETIVIARKLIIDFLENRLKNNDIDIFSFLPRFLVPRFLLKGDIEVSLWVKGHLRGAVVIEGENLAIGLRRAVIGALQDYRFKPISKEEIGDLRIEITLIHDLKVPFSQKWLNSAPFEEKGYVLNYAEKKGWLLPSVFNLRRLKNIKDLINILVVEKLGIINQDFDFKKADLRLFETQDFIESDNRKEVFILKGPILVKKDIMIDRKTIILHACAAADWLCSLQEKDGNIPPIIDPFFGFKKQIDLTRLAFSAWALAELSKVVKEKRYLKCALTSFYYLKKQLGKIIFSGSRFGINNLELTLSYFGRLALSLNEPDEAKESLKIILSGLNNLNYEPITVSQVGCLIRNVHLNERENNLLRIEKTLSLIRSYFLDNFDIQKTIYLASWAGFGEFFFAKDKELYEKIINWLKSHQSTNGSFWESNKSSFPYVRGTGKIFEVLTLEPENNKKEINHSLEWLFSMQYNYENTYFIPKEIVPLVLGGFRHDFFNQEAWIDSAGHFMLGCSRLLKHDIWQK